MSFRIRILDFLVNKLIGCVINFPAVRNSILSFISEATAISLVFLCLSKIMQSNGAVLDLFQLFPFLALQKTAPRPQWCSWSCCWNIVLFKFRRKSGKFTGSQTDLHFSMSIKEDEDSEPLHFIVEGLSYFATALGSKVFCFENAVTRQFSGAHSEDRTI